MLFAPTDFDPIDRFPLVWRWTDERHVKMNAADLATIRPLRAEIAAIAWRRLSEMPFGIAESFEGPSPDAADYVAAVRGWLGGHTRADSDLLLIWDANTAALVNAGLFARHWGDFWYPSSDDLDVVPIDESWVIRIHHYGRLERLAPK
jgi:hypothetical protein